MFIKSYFSKDNVLIYNELTNTGRNPIAELFYGGNRVNHSRYIFKIDDNRVKTLYNEGYFPDLTKLKHILKIKNTNGFTQEQLGELRFDGRLNASSFDLNLHKINQDWDNGVGYDYLPNSTRTFSISPSHWFDAKLNEPWVESPGAISGSTTPLKTIHFDKGNEDIELDITDEINSILTGETNNGFCLSFPTILEYAITNNVNYVGFYRKNTQTFFEPNLTTIYTNTIKDDRNNFIIGEHNNLYLYVNKNGNPINLDSLPSVNIYDNINTLISGDTQNIVEHITKGVYKTTFFADSNIFDEFSSFNDVWSDLIIGGNPINDIILNINPIECGSSTDVGEYIDYSDYVLNIKGLKRGERIIDNDLRKISVLPRKLLSYESVTLNDIEYRLYIKEGKNEYTVVDYLPMNMTTNINYFYLDVESLIPNKYYIDFRVKHNGEVKIHKNILDFDIISKAELNKF